MCGGGRVSFILYPVQHAARRLHFHSFLCLGPTCLPYFTPQGALSLVKVDGQAWRTRVGRETGRLSFRMTLGACSNLAFWTLGIDFIIVELNALAAVHCQFRASVSFDARATNVKAIALLTPLRAGMSFAPQRDLKIILDDLIKKKKNAHILKKRLCYLGEWPSQLRH